ncbi:MAG TPA: serine/threonine-protein kinase, partial [Minicystis sp.]|nr:serine/threonine-protein kinase [Minicystis sp.]
MTANDAAGAGRGSALPPLSVRAGPPSREARAIDLDAVMRGEEEQRARIFFLVVAALALAVLAFLPFLPGPTWLRGGTAVLLAIAVALSGLALVALRRRLYTPGFAAAVGVVAGLLGVAVMMYVGIFSAGVMVLDVGVFFFGMSHSRLAARATYVTIAGLYLVASVLLAASVIPDMSLFSIAIVPPFSRWYQVLMSQVVFATTFTLARSSRRATENAAREVQRMSAELERHDALLSEVRGELDRALRPGEGRHSGETAAGWKLGELLGKGGMGEVYRAEHVQTGGPAAVKLLHPNLLENPDHVRRFLREAEATRAVVTEHVVKVVETGTTAAGAPFIAMELLEGHDLGWHLRRAGRLSLKEVVELVDQVARALVAMRAAGIVHRDLKPANLFATDSLPRTWKVLDFGLSKILGGHTITRDQAIGTPSYMAPEQVRGQEVDHQTDLYALASLAYRTLTGTPPFAGDQVAHILYKVLYSQPPAPASFAKLPVDVELVLAVGMSKERQDRFHYVEEFVDALRRAANGELDDATRARLLEANLRDSG